MSNRHLQSVVGAVLFDLVWLLRRPVHYQREHLPAFDGNDLYLDWYLNEHHPDESFTGDGLTLAGASQSFLGALTGAANPPVMPPAKTPPAKNSSTKLEQRPILRRRGSSIVKRISRQDSEEPDGAAGLEKTLDPLPPDAPIVILLYGIGGKRDDAYMKQAVLQTAARSWRPVVYSYWRLDWQDHRDMDSIVKHIEDKFPRAPIFAVAFSAGGHVLATYLAAVGDKSPLVAAVTVSGCFDFQVRCHPPSSPNRAPK